MNTISIYSEFAQDDHELWNLISSKKKKHGICFSMDFSTNPCVWTDNDVKRMFNVNGGMQKRLQWHKNKMLIQDHARSKWGLNLFVFGAKTFRLVESCGKYHHTQLYCSLPPYHFGKRFLPAPLYQKKIVLKAITVLNCKLKFGWT